MSATFDIDHHSNTPLYKQLKAEIEKQIKCGSIARGQILPSMNVLAESLQISRETVKKTYDVMRKDGWIESVHGKGFFVSERSKNIHKILVLFDKLSNYKQLLFTAFANELGEKAEITIRLHNQDIDLFEDFVQENLDHYDYYVITPHFPLNKDTQRRALRCLKRIPNRKLILVDRNFPGLTGHYGCAYQDFEKDAIEGLRQGMEQLKKYNQLNIISMKGSLYAPYIEKGIIEFCEQHHFPCKTYHEILPERIQAHEAYLILNSQLDTELIELVTKAQAKGYTIGKDIGIISYNESQLNEVILNGLTVMSTDFIAMGKITAQMILDKQMQVIHCPFGLILRKTL